MSSIVQAVIFDTSHWSTASSEAWLREKGYLAGTPVDECDPRFQKYTQLEPSSGYTYYYIHMSSEYLSYIIGDPK